jgi:phenylpropionate dioxygenase-like ring-hydroxylating dioxygenase large terminal subunit
VLVSEMTFLRDYWYPVAEAATVDAPRAVRLFGEQFVLWPSGEGAFTLADTFCPHRSANLVGGWVDGGDIVCPYHGWRFDGSGHCTLVPQMDPGLPAPPRAALRTYPTAVRYGMVWACIGTNPVDAEPPVWREAADHPEWRFFVEFFEQWEAAAPRIIDNNLDASHVAYVHRTTFGDPDDALLPPIALEPTGTGGFSTRLHATQKGIGRQNGAAADEHVRFERVNEIELLAPMTTRTRLYFGGHGHDYCFFGAATPVDDHHAMYMRLSALAGPEDEQPWESFHEFGKRVKEEDRVILESTEPDFPVDVTSEVHLRSDRTTLEYRRYLMRLSSTHGAGTDA